MNFELIRYTIEAELHNLRSDMINTPLDERKKSVPPMEKRIENLEASLKELNKEMDGINNEVDIDSLPIEQVVEMLKDIIWRRKPMGKVLEKYKIPRS